MSILFFIAIVIAVACSTALPIIGIIINPTNSFDKCNCSAIGSILPTNNSLSRATNDVAINKTIIYINRKLSKI